MGFYWSTDGNKVNINLFKGLGYLDRLQGNLSSTETVDLLEWERRHQDHALLVLVDLEL